MAADPNETHLDGPLRTNVLGEGIDVGRDQTGNGIADSEHAFSRVDGLAGRVGRT